MTGGVSRKDIGWRRPRARVTWGTRHRSAFPYQPYRRLYYHRLGRSSGRRFSQTPWVEPEACGGFRGALAAPLAGHGQNSSGREPPTAVARASEPVIVQ